MAVTDKEWDDLVARVSRLNKQCDRLEDTVSGRGSIWGETNLKRQMDTLHAKLDRLLAAQGQKSTG